MIKIKLWWQGQWRFWLWWDRLWIRQNEFHRSLSFNGQACWRMSPKRRAAYLADLLRRRRIAHERDLARK